ncbi:MAG TPA: NAD(P)-dependent oxidoreductase [Gemmatimonadales bacterium]|nr:NAD(P)-dependent oxidoreductase [Gemmatimonadales bacterium]
MSSSITVAVLGLGRMGLPMARNLVAAGFPVRAWNRSPGRGEGLPGATIAATPREAAAGAEVAITMLADDRAVEQVALGPDGLLSGLAAGAVHLGMSTVSVGLTRRLAEAHAAVGQGYVAAPVFGRPDAAAERRLWIVAGGEEPHLGRCRPVFEALGQGTFAVGGAPQAALAKLIGNFLIAATIESLGEALALGEKGGLDPRELLDLLAGTLFGSPVVRGYGARIAATEFEPAGFALALGLKDVELALEAARELGARLPLAELARDRLRRALERGRDGYDWAGFASVIREDAGLPPRRQ